MTDWRSSRLIAGMVVGLFLVVQLTVPVLRLTRDESQRFGWQMYSSTSVTPAFMVETATGVVEVDARDYTAELRAEVDVVARLPQHLCTMVPGAVTVTWKGGSHRC